MQTRAGACHLSSSEPLLQADASWHSSREERPRARHFLITAYRASFCISVDNGQSAKHSQLLPACSDSIPGTHPCLTVSPIAIGEEVPSTLGKPQSTQQTVKPHPPDGSSSKAIQPPKGSQLPSAVTLRLHNLSPSGFHTQPPEVARGSIM